LEHGLLNYPVHHVGNAKPPLPASGLRQPDPANIARPIASRQQGMTQGGEERRGILLRFRDAIKGLRLPDCARSTISRAADTDSRERNGQGATCRRHG